MRTPGARAGLAAVVLLAPAGCGDDEPTFSGEVEPSSPGSGISGPSATADPVDPVEPFEPVDCVTDAVATFPDGGEVALQDGRAVGLGGPAYTIFSGDFEVPADGLMTSGAQAGPGQHLAFVATTVYNGTADGTEQLEIGVPIPWTDEFEVLTFAVVLDEEGAQLGDNRGAAGTLTVTALDGDAICVEVDYTDDQKSVVGTIAAEIV